MKTADVQRVCRDIHQAVRGAQHVLLITHAKPDGDAIGSLCAMGCWLKNQGRQVTLLCVDPVPHEFRYIVHTEDVVQDMDPSHTHPDVVVLLDISDPERAQVAELLDTYDRSGHTRIVVDHHATYSPGADIAFHNPSASSTCELVHQLFEEIGHEYSPHEATALLTGIMTDTEGYANHATSPTTLQCSRTLAHRGAHLTSIVDAVHRSRTFGQLKAMGVGLRRLCYHPHTGMVASIFKADDRELTTEEGALSGFANLLKRTNSGKVILVLHEQADGTIRGSLRSIDTRVNVARFAQLFSGGGGHELAAGFTVRGELVEENNTWSIR